MESYGDWGKKRLENAIQVNKLLQMNIEFDHVAYRIPEGGELEFRHGCFERKDIVEYDPDAMIAMMVKSRETKQRKIYILCSRST